MTIVKSVKSALATSLILFVAAAAGAQAPSCVGQVYNCFSVRTLPANLSTVLASHNLTVVEDLWPSSSDALKMVTGPSNLLPETTLANLEADSMVLIVELLDAQALPEQSVTGILDTSDPAFVSTLASTGSYSGPETPHFAGSLWNGYAAQPALSAINLPAAHADPRPEAMGSGVVAIIDTGVDPSHPLLQGALVPGYDFLLNQAGIPSEWEALDPATRAQDEADLRAAADQSVTGILDGSATSVTKGASEAIVEQSVTGILDAKSLPAGFGHGTMVAGLVRLVAPNAKIMPLRVFEGDGTASLGNIIRAIYWAVDNGANVINMSFSTADLSFELHKAIVYAGNRGVVCVSSVGNSGALATLYPSTFPQVVGVGSVDDESVRSSFTNWGPVLVALAAPGEALVTLYPGDLYAAVSGTSFSSGLVAGTVALMHDLDGSTLTPIDAPGANLAFAYSSQSIGDLMLGAGLLDVDHAMNCGLSGGTC